MTPRARTVFLQAPGRLRSGWRLAIFLLLLTAAITAFFMILLAAGVVHRHAHAAVAPTPIRRLPGVLSVVVAVLLASAALLRATDRRTLSTLGLAWRWRAIPGAIVGLLAGALPVAASVAILALLGVASVRPATPPAALLAPAALTAVAVTTLESALEELLWRGYAFQLLIEGAGRWIAVVVTAVLWGLAHADNPGANAFGVVYILLSGALLAWIVIRTGSLWFAIGYHIAWNVTAAHVFGLVLSGFDLGTAPLRTTLSGPAWLAGGGFGFEASVVTEILDLAGLSVALLLSGFLPRLAEALPYFERRAVPAETAPPPPADERPRASEFPGEE